MKLKNCLLLERKDMTNLKVKVTQSCWTLFHPIDYTVHGIFQARILESVAFPFFRESSQPRELNPGPFHCRWILYKLSHKGKPSNSGMGRLSLLQWILPTQESNQGLLDCRWILYQLSYQGTPDKRPVNCTKENLFIFKSSFLLYFTILY